MDQGKLKMLGFDYTLIIRFTNEDAETTAVNSTMIKEFCALLE